MSQAFTPTSQELAQFALRSFPEGFSCSITDESFYKFSDSDHFFMKSFRKSSLISVCGADHRDEDFDAKLSLMQAFALRGCSACLNMMATSCPSYGVWFHFFTALMRKELLCSEIDSFSDRPSFTVFEDLLSGVSRLVRNLPVETKEVIALEPNYYSVVDAKKDSLSLLGKLSDVCTSYDFFDDPVKFAVAAWFKTYRPVISLSCSNSAKAGLSAVFNVFKTMVLKKPSSSSMSLSSFEIDVFCTDVSESFFQTAASEILLEFLPKWPVLNRDSFPDLVSWMRAEAKHTFKAFLRETAKAWNAAFILFESSINKDEVLVAWNCFEFIFLSADALLLMLPYLCSAVSTSDDSPWLIFAMPEFLASALPLSSYSNSFSPLGFKKPSDDEKVLETTVSFFSFMEQKEAALEAARRALSPL